MSITNSKFLRVRKGKLKTDQQYNLLQCVSIFFLEKLREHYQFNISAMIFQYSAVSWEKDIIRKIHEQQLLLLSPEFYRWTPKKSVG